MTRRPVSLRAAAANDVDKVVDYYLNEAGESVALKFIAAFQGSLERIGRSPSLGSLRFSYELGIPDLRVVPLDDFPHMIFYTVATDRVDVWRVLHSRRDIPVEVTDTAGEL